MKTLYLIRHAETEENVRIQGLRDVGSSLIRFQLPKRSDIELGAEGLGGFACGHIDSELSKKGKAQVQKLKELLDKENFLANITMIAHSPLVRAVYTCNGILGSDSKIKRVKMDCLSELTPAEFVFQLNFPGRRRIRDLGELLDDQEDETIALVGHSQYFKKLLCMKEKFRNCDVWKVKYEGKGVYSTPELLYRIPSV